MRRCGKSSKNKAARPTSKRTNTSRSSRRTNATSATSIELALEVYCRSSSKRFTQRRWPEKHRRLAQSYCRRCLAFLIVDFTLASFAGGCALNGGPYRTPEPLPREKRLVDMHCHTAGIGGAGSGCFVSTKLKHSWKFGVYLKSFGVT